MGGDMNSVSGSGNGEIYKFFKMFSWIEKIFAVSLGMALQQKIALGEIVVWIIFILVTSLSLIFWLKNQQIYMRFNELVQKA
jgi:hypothetical protein